MASCSIVIPCYNGAKFLDATIRSVLTQTKPPQEIIVVDDGSTDASADIATRYGPPVKVLRQANQGESVARNAGLREAAGNYVLFLDADDLLAPEAIERLAAAVGSSTRAVAVMGTAHFTDDPGAPTETHLPSATTFFPTIVQTNFGPPHCWYTPRQLATEVGGFREDLVNSEDWEFWSRIALTGAPLVAVHYVGALYRRHPQSQVATTPKPAIFRGRLLVAETMAAAVLERPALVDEVGEALFWSLWAMYEQARLGGVPAGDLHRAEDLLREIARRRPGALKRSAFGFAVRYLGARTAGRLRHLTAPLARLSFG
jgi:glycosyltransferase involved in cell wall biosynthesis